MERDPVGINRLEFLTGTRRPPSSTPGAGQWATRFRNVTLRRGPDIERRGAPRFWPPQRPGPPAWPPHLWGAPHPCRSPGGQQACTASTEAAPRAFPETASPERRCLSPHDPPRTPPQSCVVYSLHTPFQAHSFYVHVFWDTNRHPRRARVAVTASQATGVNSRPPRPRPAGPQTLNRIEKGSHDARAQRGVEAKGEKAVTASRGCVLLTSPPRCDAGGWPRRGTPPVSTLPHPPP